MESMLGTAIGFIDLDLDGFFYGSEVASLFAALFTAFFGGLANALITIAYNGNGTG
jgi:hypothetical protein